MVKNSQWSSSSQKPHKKAFGKELITPLILACISFVIAVGASLVLLIKLVGA